MWSSIKKMVAKLSGAGTAFTGSKATDPHYKHQVSFSGADVKAIIHIPNDAGINPINGGRTNEIIPNSAIALTGLQTLSISIYRDKSPVRSLGYVNPVGITRGGRTIAGSMIFTILQNHPLIQLNGNYTYDYNNEFGWGWKGGHGDQFFPDACPPFNLHMVFANEVGNSLCYDVLADGTPQIGDWVDAWRPKEDVQTIEVFSDGYAKLPDNPTVAAW